jgi:hypothetical protein
MGRRLGASCDYSYVSEKVEWKSARTGGDPGMPLQMTACDCTFSNHYARRVLCYAFQ